MLPSELQPGRVPNTVLPVAVLFDVNPPVINTETKSGEPSLANTKNGVSDRPTAGLGGGIMSSAKADTVSVPEQAPS